jgi:hypothetical protein
VGTVVVLLLFQGGRWFGVFTVSCLVIDWLTSSARTSGRNMSRFLKVLLKFYCDDKFERETFETCLLFRIE